FDLATKADANGNPEIDAADKTVLHVTPEEIEELAHHYASGQTLWRVALTHFSTNDLNWPYGLPSDACNGDPDCQPDGPSASNPNPDQQCEANGSVIECQGQVLGESVPVTGTPYRLQYASDRVAGRREAYRLEIPLIGKVVPPSLKRIDLVIQVAGKLETHSFPCPCDGV